MKVRSMVLISTSVSFVFFFMVGMNVYYLINSEPYKALLSLFVLAPVVIIPLLLMRRKRKPQTAREILMDYAKRNSYTVLENTLNILTEEDLKNIRPADLKHFN